MEGDGQTTGIGTASEANRETAEAQIIAMRRRRADKSIQDFITRADPKLRRGSSTSEFKLAVGLPAVGGLLTLLMAALDQVPAWAQTENVVMAAIAGVAFLGGCYILSRGQAKG